MKLRTAITLATVAVTAVATLAIGPPDGKEWIPKTENVFIRIGCETADGGGTGSCETTERFLSQFGVSSGGNVGAVNEITPLTYVQGPTWSSYSEDATIQDSYILRAGTIDGQMTIMGAGGATVGADATLDVRLSATKVGGGFQLIGSASVNKQVAALDNVYQFTMVVPEEVDGVEVTGLTFEHAFRGVHVVTNGWIDGNDGSFFDLPYYQEVDATA